MHTRWYRAILATLLLLGPLACSDSTDAGPVAASIQLDRTAVSVEDGQTDRLMASVLDRNGNPLTPLPSGTALTWSTSDAAVASVSGGFVTGNRPGTAEIAASVGDVRATATVTVTMVPRRLDVVGGDAQQGVAGDELRDSLVLRVTDRHGSGMGGVTLVWEVTSGNGLLVGVTSTSDASGYARAVWRLGGIGGTQTVTVRSPQVPGVSALFSATAVGGPDAPFITGVGPAVLRPGETAVIAGGNFDLDLPALVVTVGGVAATVTQVAAGELTILLPSRSQLPCGPLSDVAVTVTSRGFTAVRPHPLRAGLQRNLTVGGSVILNGADDLACNELAPGRYLISTFNSGRVIGATATVELRGAVSANAPVSAAVDAVSPPPATHGRAAPGPAAERRSAVEHQRILDTNREILRTLSPEFRRRRELTRSLEQATAAAAAAGDTLTFRVPKTSAPPGQICSSYDVVRARAVYVGERAVVFEDVAAPLAGTMDAAYTAIGQEYDGTMHEILRENFGNPLALGAELSNPTRVYMLFTRAVNDDNDAIAGFVFSGDLFPREQCASSDRAAIFYATVPTVAGAGYERGRVDGWRWTMRSTIIHEVKHITSFVERLSRDADRWEESWLEESTARISEELWARRIFGYPQRGNVTYGQSMYCEGRPNWTECLGSPYVMLKHFSGLHTYLVSGGGRTPLGSAGPGDASFYGSGWSLVRWAIDQSSLSEAAFLKALTQDTRLAGIANLEARAGRSLAQMLPRWSLGLATAGLPGYQPQDAAISFPSWNIAEVFTALNGDFPQSFGPTPQRLTVGGGVFERPTFALLGGATAVFELQSSASTRTVQLRGGAGVDPAPSVGMAIIRVN